MDQNNSTKEISLAEALIGAHRYSSLAGESPAQDAAILRLLIAIAYTVFYRTDEDGQPASLWDEDAALDRWEAIWRRREFPAGPVRAYIDQWHGRFDLLDETHPFYQVPEASIGTPHTAAKLNGSILQSENKVRIFAGRAGGADKSLTLSEAARWLIYLQGYDDASVKPKTPDGKKNVKTKPGSARGWLGNLGMIYALGDNLFETIWINTVFLKDGEQLYGEPLPSWELEQAKTGEYISIPLPNDLAELFTLQSRRVLLKMSEGLVTEYSEYCGDLLGTENAFAEPMTVWRPVKKKAETIGYSPKPHAPSRQLWRDFSTVAVQSTENRLPGITYWLKKLQEDGGLERERLMRFAAVSVLYDSSGSSVTNTVSDSLSFHVDLLTEAGYIWQKHIVDQVHLCDRLAFAVGELAGELAIAAGKRETENKKAVPASRMSAAEAAKEQYYYRIDTAFRQWLLRPKAGQIMEEITALCAEWQDTARRIAQTLGRELADGAGEAAFIGRWAESDSKETKYHYSTPEAFNKFIGRITKA